MAAKLPFKTTFETEHVIRPIYTGGSVGLDSKARILATTLGEDAVLTDLETGKHLATIEGDSEPISTLTITPSASHLIICSRSLSMRIFSLQISPDYDTVEATLVRTLKPHGTPVVVLAVDRTGTLLATGAADGSIKVWDILGGYVTHTLSGSSVLVSALLFFEIASGLQGTTRKSKKGHRKSQSETEDAGNDKSNTPNFHLASGSQDGTIRVWDLHKRGSKPIAEPSHLHASDVRGLDYSSEHQLLVSASRDKTLIWWDVTTWEGRSKPCLEGIEAVGFLENGRLTYSAGVNGNVRIWDTSTRRELTKDQQPKAEDEAVVAAISCPEKGLILCVLSDFTITLYRNPLPGKENQPPRAFRRICGTHDDILDLRYILPDKSVLALATNSDDVRLISVAELSRNEEHTEASSDYFGQDVAVLKGHEDMVVSLDVDWSGHWVATGSKDNTARLWRVDVAGDSYACYSVFSGHVGTIGAVCLPKTAPVESTDAFQNPLDHPPAFLLTGSGDLTVKKWAIPRKPQQGKDGLRAIFSVKAHDKDINAIDINASDRLFASASQDRVVKIRDVESGEVQGILKGHRRGVWSVKFPPANMPQVQGEQGAVSGKGVVLTSSGDKTIKLWSLADFSCIRTFEGHSNNVLKVSWLNIPEVEASKKHIRFASAGADGLVKVWDANLGEAECTLDNHEDKVWALAVHPKTNTIVSAGGDSVITLWKDTTEATQAEATEAVQKLMEQEQELENYIYAGSYRDAITLALQLNHPGRLLSIFTSVVTTSTPEKGSLSGVKAVDQVLASLSDEQLFLLLLRLRDWNTNARTAPISQRILSTLVRSYPASKFSKLSVKGARGQRSLKEVLNALKVYTERHYKRMEDLMDESYLVEYTLQEMDSLAASWDHSVDSTQGGPKEDALMIDAN